LIHQIERVYIPPTLIDIGEIHIFLILHNGPFLEVYLQTNKYVFHGPLYCLKNQDAIKVNHHKVIKIFPENVIHHMLKYSGVIG